ncbi:MAG: hypothetical protein V7K47_12440 [Nostoc sp.]
MRSPSLDRILFEVGILALVLTAEGSQWRFHEKEMIYGISALR